MEIERKYLVTAAPPDLAEHPSRPIRQGYLAEEGAVEVRLRQAGEVHTLTVKGGSGLVRVEEEVALTPAQFETLWPLTEARRVEKVRHLIPYEGRIVELDVFGGALTGLLLAEVEFPTVDASQTFVAPPWFGDEVTGRREFSNASLAKRPA